jgi:hypothetical protein
MQLYDLNIFHSLSFNELLKLKKSELIIFEIEWKIEFNIEDIIEDAEKVFESRIYCHLIISATIAKYQPIYSRFDNLYFLINLLFYFLILFLLKIHNCLSDFIHSSIFQ